MPTLIEPTPPYAALIFDCDGTVADTLPLHYQSWADTARIYGIELTSEWYYQRAGLSSLEMVKVLNQTFDCQLDLEQVKAEKHRRYQTFLHLVQPIEPVTQIVEQHRGKVPLAIASGGSRAMVEATLTQLELIHCFEVILTIENVAEGKPAPDLFLLAAQALGVLPKDCIVYEDSEIGLEAARLAGMRAIDVKPVWRSRLSQVDDMHR